MRIDPSMMKQLLQLQLTQSVDSFSGGGTGIGGESGTDFAGLLEELLNETMLSSPGGKVIPAAELLARAKGNAYPVSWFNTGLDWQTDSAPTDYDALIRDTSAKHGVDSSLVKAVIRAESNFDSGAVSHAGAKGLMQLMDKTGQGLGVQDPFDPEQNIEGGTRFLAGLLQKYNGNEGVALAAYNAGPGRVDRLGIRNDLELREKLSLLPKETQKYVAKVLDYKAGYQV